MQTSVYYKVFVGANIRLTRCKFGRLANGRTGKCSAEPFPNPNEQQEKKKKKESRHYRMQNFTPLNQHWQFLLTMLLATNPLCCGQIWFRRGARSPLLPLSWPTKLHARIRVWYGFGDPRFFFFNRHFFFFFSCQRGSPLTADSSVVLDLAAGFPAPLLNQLTKLSPIRVQNVLCSAQCIKGCSVGWTFGKHLANSGVWRIAELADVRPNLCSGRTVPQPKWTAGNHTN